MVWHFVNNSDNFMSYDPTHCCVIIKVLWRFSLQSQTDGNSLIWTQEVDFGDYFTHDLLSLIFIQEEAPWSLYGFVR
jgi:hypothetical protein